MVGAGEQPLNPGLAGLDRRAVGEAGAQALLAPSSEDAHDGLVDEVATMLAGMGGAIARCDVKAPWGVVGDL